MASFSLPDEARTFNRRKEEERKGQLDEESREKLGMVYSWLSTVYGNRQPPEWEMNPFTISFVWKREGGGVGEWGERGRREKRRKGKGE